jgi:Leucine-rich repeat (LRR) protein
MDMSYNKLKAFTYDFFGNKFTTNRLRKLNLNNNELAKLDNNLFAVLRNLVSLNLSGVRKILKGRASENKISYCRTNLPICPPRPLEAT